MKRVFLTVGLLAALAGSARPSQDVYPPLSRETLNGVWEGIFGIGTHPTLFHITIAPQDSDSYLSEFDPDSMKGGVFRMDGCSVTEGRVRLHFSAVWPVADGRGWWFEGEGVGDSRRAWIDARFGTDLDKRSSGPPTFRLEKGTWVRRLGEASLRAAEDIKRLRDGK